jgi:MFS family permease
LTLFAVGIVAVLAIREPGRQRPGVLASLRPRVAVPREARRTFAGAVPCFVAVWALGGLYVSLGPSLVAQITGSRNLLWGGVVIFLLTGTGGVSSLVLRGITSRAAMLIGLWFLLAGIAVTLIAITTTTTVTFLAGTAVAGVGYGLAYLGAFRLTIAEASPAQRAGLLAAIYILVYLAFGVPALIAGVTTTKFGLHSTALVYSASLVVVVGVAIGLLFIAPRAKGAGRAPAIPPVIPPGPCTCPPCRQALDPGDRVALGGAKPARTANVMSTPMNGGQRHAQS